MKREVSLYIFDKGQQRGSQYGIGTYVRIVSGLVKDSWNVSVICLNSSGKGLYLQEKDGINYWHIPVPQIRREEKDQALILIKKHIIFYLKQIITETEEKRIFHLNYMIDPSIVLQLKKNFQCSVIYTVHNIGWLYDLAGNLQLFQKIVSKKKKKIPDKWEEELITCFEKEKIFYNSVDRIISLSMDTFNLLTDTYQIPERKVVVIYNGLPNKKKNLQGVKKLRNKYRLPENTPVLLFVGRLEYVKGLTFLINAFNLLLSVYPSVHFVIAGEGDYDHYLQQAGNDWMHIHFTGLLDQKSLYELYSIATIGVIPSLHEQCSFVGIEMMMHGLPIVALNSVGITDMVLDGITGILIPRQESEIKVRVDINLFMKKLLWLLQNPEIAMLLGKNGRKRYEQLYSISEMQAKMISLYNTVTKK